MPTLRPYRTLSLAAAALLPLAAACADGPTGPGDDTDEIARLTVDAAAGWALVAFDGDEASAVTAADPTTSEAWDLGFFATSVMLNGGAAGPAGVEGYCVCQNDGASDAQILAMTAEGELADFEAVDASAIPADDGAWTSDALAPAIDGWYAYDPINHVVSAAPENVWKVRTASGDAFAKLHVTGIEGAAQQHPGTVTLEFAVQTAAGEPFGDVETMDVDASAGPVHLDLETASVVGEGDDWDVMVDGWDIRVNGGVSGSASAGASLADEAFGDIDDAGDLTAGHYAGDAFGGVFDAHPWYRYNLEGGHQIWPTYDVYLVRRGDAVYKVQLTSYYGPTGDSRQITFRYERLQ